MRYNRGMLEMRLAATDQVLLEEVATLRLGHAAMRAENAALQDRVRELEARLGENSSNLSRPPSSDPPLAPPRPKARPLGRKRGGQPGHHGTFRALLPEA
jgi:transposase